MKQLILVFSLLITIVVSAQEKDSLSQAEKERREQNIQAGNPFKKYGYTPKIATLSKGKYLEWHDLDSIVIIGSVYFNTKTKKIVDFVERDMTNPDAQPLSDIRGRWISPDPLTEEFPDWSPYNFVYSNPLRFNDPTGMAGEDVILHGKFKDEAFQQLQSSVEGQLNLAMDDNGKVTATAVEGAELSEASQTFLAATQDTNIDVHLVTTDAFSSKSGAALLGGSFQGSIVRADGSIDAVNLVNTSVLATFDTFFGKTLGVGILHEAIEGYVGAQQSPGSPPSTSFGDRKGEGYYNWDKAHKESVRIDPRAGRTPDQKIVPGFTNKGGVEYRSIFLKKGTGGNVQSKTLVDKYPKK